VSPGFLLRNFRYAILLIFIVAAVVTPTSDVMNMMIFAIPMIGLFVLGIALVWLVQRKRKSRWAWR
jgi:sec-independent protein translocase protein TatC